MSDNEQQPDESQIYTPRLWRDKGWTAKVVKNDDFEGWAVEMILDGHAEPALIGPWTMGRNKVDPKPLDAAAFGTLVKTASEFIRRSEQQRHHELNKQLQIEHEGDVVLVKLVLTPDEYEPYGTLSAFDVFGELLGEVKVAPTFKLSRDSAEKWARSDYARIH